MLSLSQQSHSSGIVASLLPVIAAAVAKEKARNNSDERRTRGKVEVTQLIESPKKNKRRTEAKAAEMFGTKQHEQVSKLDT